MEQLVARRAHNPEAVGSNPAPATKEIKAVHQDGFLFPYFKSWGDLNGSKTAWFSKERRARFAGSVKNVGVAAEM